MNNQITFIDHTTQNFTDSLGISEERRAEIIERVYHFQLVCDSNSECIEKTIEGLNPNEAAFAAYLTGIVAGNWEIIKKISSQM